MMADQCPIIREPEEVIASQKSKPNKEDAYFDTVVGHLQDLVIGDEFQKTRDAFMAKHKGIFEDKEENKLEYMPIFQSWTQLIEGSLEKYLIEKVPGFTMDAFLKMLPKRQQQIEDELYDMLVSLGDFQTFKDEMLLAKKGDERMGDLSEAFVVHNIRT